MGNFVFQMRANFLLNFQAAVNLFEVNSVIREFPACEQCNPGTSWKQTVPSANLLEAISAILEPSTNPSRVDHCKSSPTKSSVRNFPRQIQGCIRNKPGAKFSCIPGAKSPPPPPNLYACWSYVVIQVCRGWGPLDDRMVHCAAYQIDCACSLRMVF